MKRVLITGGAGFIGSNLAHKMLLEGYEVIIFDNLSRKGTEENLKWLKNQHGRINFIQGDVRNFREIKESVENIDVIYHAAGQVAVTSSVENPREDFEVNALGTLNVLEAARLSDSNPILLFTSTNKVYGGMGNVEVNESDGKYDYKHLKSGAPETTPLDFHSPYGCSKGAADQYVRDFSRIYDLKSIVFRMSCIYGPHQFGNEDQGWVAHFTISSIFNRPISIYGDGKQIRDILYIDDLMDAFTLATENIEKTSGEIYNIGGGPQNTVSLLELLDMLEVLNGYEIDHSFNEWRPGDQKVFYCDITKAGKDFGWEPKINPEEGVEKMFKWMTENKELLH